MSVLFVIKTKYILNKNIFITKLKDNNSNANAQQPPPPTYRSYIIRTFIIHPSNFHKNLVTRFVKIMAVLPPLRLCAIVYVRSAIQQIIQLVRAMVPETESISVVIHTWKKKSTFHFPL